jgi:hypothetical protein
MTSSLAKNGNLADLRSDIIITLVITSIMGLAFVESFDYKDVAGLFPRSITLVGLILGVAYGVSLLVKHQRIKSGLVSDKSQATPLPDMEYAPDTESIDYVYATAGRRAWISSILWVAAFLVLTVALGLFIASFIFSFVYLRWNAGKSWIFSGVYAVSITLFLVALFRWLLYIPTPIGILSGL